MTKNGEASMLLARWCALLVFPLLLVFAVAVAVVVGLGKHVTRGDELLFVSYHEINPDIFIADIERGLVLNLTRSAAYDAEPAWSPDGEWIAFVSDREGPPQLFIMDASGRYVRRLTTDRRAYSAPRWTADGQRIVFFARGGATELYSINVDGSNLELLTTGGPLMPGILLDLGIETTQTTRVFSPDRTQMLMMRPDDGTWRMYIGENRESLRLLASIGRGYTESPVWSPSAERVAFVGSDGGRPDIYVVGVFDQRTRRITHTPAIDASPVWRPRF